MPGQGLGLRRGVSCVYELGSERLRDSRQSRHKRITDYYGTPVPVGVTTAQRRAKERLSPLGAGIGATLEALAVVYMHNSRV